MNLYGVQKIYILYLYLDILTDRRTDSFNARFLSEFYSAKRKKSLQNPKIFPSLSALQECPGHD